MTLIAMFPGQSSRYPDMLSKFERLPICTDLLAAASETLGRDLINHYRSKDPFATSRDVQVGVFLANHLHLVLLAQRGIVFHHSLGHSLGEFNHLVHAGALTFDDALRLVDARGSLCDRGRAGVMVSVFPIEARRIEAAIAKLGNGQLVGVGAYNSPYHTLLSGDRAAIDAVLFELEREGPYLDATIIDSKTPMHAPCYGETAARFAEVVASVPFAVPGRYVPNVRGYVVEQPPPELIRQYLVRHVDHPVRWRASVEAVAASVSDPCFVEVGPRAALYTLFGKDWMPGRRAKSDAALDAFTHLDAVAQELRAA